MDVLLIGNDQIIKVLGVQDADTLAFINSATVTVVLKNLDGTQLTGQTWPLLLTYVASSDGDYKGILEDSVVLKANQRYVVEVTADDGPLRKGFWHFTRPASYRDKE